MSIQCYIDDFLISKEVEDGCSSNTVNAYKHDLILFQKEIPQNLDIIQINQVHIRAFLKVLKDKNYTKMGISRKIACLKSFFGYLEKTSIIQQNPMKQINSPKIKAEEHLPKFLNLEEMKKLMVYLKTGEGLQYNTKKRIYLIVRLLYATMARVSEIANVKIGDIDFSNELLRLRGKGNKERIVPIDKETLALINDMLSDRIAFKKEDPLLVNKYGHSLGVRSIQKDIQMVKNAIGFGNDKKMTPHVFRHTGATHLRQAGMDISELQDLLGHSSPNTTRIYAKNDISRIHESYKTKHPLNNLHGI